MDIRTIEKYIALHKGKIGLADWIITARRPTKGETTNRAFVTTDPIQLRAETVWHLSAPDWKVAPDDEREQIILHELCHVLLSRYSQVVHDTICDYTDKAKYEELIARIDDQEESLCGKLSAVFHKLVKGSE